VVFRRYAVSSVFFFLLPLENEKKVSPSFLTRTGQHHKWFSWPPPVLFISKRNPFGKGYFLF